VCASRRSPHSLHPNVLNVAQNLRAIPGYSATLFSIIGLSALPRAVLQPKAADLNPIYLLNP
jgi:hypothetical protein